MDSCNNGNHHHHHHAPQNEKRLFWAAIVTGIFMFSEIAGGILSGSLALLADAGHMLTDFASLIMAWIAFVMARRPATTTRTFGFERLQILAAFVNGISLFFIAIWIVKEAIERFYHPVEIETHIMMSIALLGLIVNIIAFKILHSAETDNLNIRGAIIHVMGDMLGSVAALIGGIIIYYKNWTIVDPILSGLIALILLRSAWYVVKESGNILLENVPCDIVLENVRKECMAHFPCIEDIHHVHAWAIKQDRIIITMHVKLNKRIPPEEITCEIKRYLFQTYSIDHATIEVEYELCADNMLPSLSKDTSDMKCVI